MFHYEKQKLVILIMSKTSRILMKISNISYDNLPNSIFLQLIINIYGRQNSAIKVDTDLLDVTVLVS